ncbi:MAG: glycosyltransferase, partial [Bryobacteraceae bacterium]|nr:glycosyltransferase [Bryobacteraceae bacterium]
MNLKLPLRVVHVVHRLDPGGLENLVMQMVLGADPAVVEPSVLCLSGIGELGQMYRDRVRITAVPAEPGYDRRAMAEMRRQIRRIRPAVVHSHDERPHLFATAGALSAGLPLPVRLNTVHLVYTDTSKKAIFRRWTLARATDVMVAVGERVRRNLIELDHIAPAKVRTILNGTALDVPRLERQQARRALGLADDALVVGAVGRLAPVKDHRTL